jgi:hypothetical protein
VRLSTLVLLIPAALIAAVIAIANRGIVVFRLDPFSSEHPAVAFAMPLYLLVFLALLFGVILGGATVALSRARRPAPPARITPPPVPQDSPAPVAKSVSQPGSEAS